MNSRFLKSTDKLSNLNIVGILLGGSVIYKHNELNTLDRANDWDGLILVQRQIDIVNLINRNRQTLCELFDISIEEYPNFHVPQMNNESFDAVRFAGVTSENIKKSFKILNVEHLNRILSEYDRKGQINILSCKDGRVAGCHTENERYRRRIRQSTRFDENLFILHDMDLFVSERCHKHGYSAVTFGVSTDLLMSGCWIYQDHRQIGDSISMNLLLKLSRFHPEPLPQSDLIQIFAKHLHFQPKYKQQLTDKLMRFQTVLNISLVCISKLECDNECATTMDFLWGDIPPFIDLKTLNINREEINRINLPFIQRRYSQDNLILTNELERAEDMLRVYCISATMLSDQIPSIHQLFYERLVNKKCLREFYGNGIQLSNDKHFTFQQLISRNLNINGKQYGNLQQIIDKAEQLLCSNAFIDQFVIFGRSNTYSKNAEYHSPILDLAIYFYYDVFFNIFYASEIYNDNLFALNIIELTFNEDDTFTIQLNLPSNMLNKTILEIKRRYMLLPFLEFIDKTQGKLKMCDNWSSMFDHALFCCALLTRNFCQRADILFANVALGVLLTDSKILNLF